ncbi:MAG: hypothetical protein IPJ98_00560 [Bryobacterales bacterium]|nr:hypothetical protein [Bryobacterales bacterium]
MFLFEQMFDTALRGIMTAGLMSTILIVAYGILLASLLFAVYEAWTRGSDVRALAIAGAKYLGVGLLLINNGTVYESVFRAVLGAFNQLAHTMAGVGPNDVFSRWLNELWSLGVTSGTFLNFVTGSLAGILSALLLVVAMILYPVAYMLFAVLYCLFGTILFVAGPLVLALMPSFGLGSLAKRYAVNVVVFASWGLIYGIFCRLVLVLNIHSMAAITGAGSFAGALTGAVAEVLLAAASILFAVCILLIPFLARRIVEGDLGSSMFAVLGTTATLMQSLTPLAAGSGDGFGRLASGAGAGGGDLADAAANRSSSGAAPAAPASESGSGSGAGGSRSVGNPGSGAPAGPGGGRAMGPYRPINVPHAVGWLAGATAAMAVRGGQRAVDAGRNLARRAGERGG